MKTVKRTIRFTFMPIPTRTLFLTNLFSLKQVCINPHQYFFIFIILIISVLNCRLAVSAETTPSNEFISPLKPQVNIGVLNNGNKSKTSEEWQSVSDYLNSAITDIHFKITPSSYSELESSIKKQTIDFVFTNSAHYIKLQSIYGITRLATVVRLNQDHRVTSIGGVIFTRADRSDIKTLTDLRHKRLTAVEEHSLGGFLAAYGTLIQSGIDPFRDLSTLQFTEGSPEKVIREVLEGSSDAGTVNTGVLDRMASEYKLDLTQIKILNHQKHQNFPYFLSTQLYPEWPFARLKEVDNNLSKKITIALLKQGFIVTENGEGYTWDVPQNYQPVLNLLKRLEVAPFNTPTKFGWRDVLAKYVNKFVTLIALAFLSALFIVAKMTNLNRSLKSSVQDLTSTKLALLESNETLEEKVLERTQVINRELTKQIQLQRDVAQREKRLLNERNKYQRLIENLQDNYFFYILDNQRKMTYVSPSIKSVLGFNPDAFIAAHQPFKKAVCHTPVGLSEETALANQNNTAFSLELQNKEGELQTLELSETPLLDEQTNEITSIEGIAHDITESHQSLTERTVRAEVLEQLATGASLENVLKLIVDNANKHMFRETTCIIALLDGGGKTFTSIIAPDCPSSFTDKINSLPVEYGAGSTGTAAATRKRVIIDNLSTHPFGKLLRGVAMQQGINACWSEPIISSQQKLLGVMDIYYQDEATPSHREIIWACNLTELAALAIEKKQLEQEIRLAAITFQTNDAIVITDHNAKILRVNEAFFRITGLSPKEIIGKNPNIFKADKDGDRYDNAFWKKLSKSSRLENESLNKHKDGSTFPVRQQHTAVNDRENRTSHFVIIFSDITQQKSVESKIKQLAYYDPLTNLPNRRLLISRLEKALSFSKRHKFFGALLFMDLDHFKKLNDTLGHHIGDELLKQVGRRIKRSLRKEDTAARLSGDEFIALLPGNFTDKIQATDHSLAVGNKILTTLRKEFKLGEHIHHITPSIGVTIFPSGNVKAQEFLKQADTAMYKAKEQGRNTICFFQPDMQVTLKERLDIEEDLKLALEKDHFQLYFQAQVNGASDLLSAETLVRWQHPKKGLLKPTDFIPIAEESGLILPIGEWIIEHACQQIKAWNDTNFNLPYLAVNVSPKQFHHPAFVSQITESINRNGIDASQLRLEITESLMLENIENTVKKMLELNSIGINLSIDDFGTGYSSLAYLKQLPVTQIKIDRSFIADIHTDPNDAIIVETILSMANHMKLDVIAEGVEKKEQFEFLQNKGCKKFQGFFYGLPMPMDEFKNRWVDGSSKLH